MKPPVLSGAEIRQDFVDFFITKGHTFVPSSSLVPGGDATLLFTNAGMVQFKDVFLGTDRRPYTRAVNSQKCLRVAGKHNDLEDVGQDNTHHTFFEMLGNWSFGDYYKKEAIAWAWELLTEVWNLPKENLYATCFQDEKGEIPRDDEAAGHWLEQPGFVPEHVRFFGRKDNFWEMAETGPCGPNSEIHIDRGIDFCNHQHIPEHICDVNGDCNRFLELWNLVFIQYNRTGPRSLEPLPAKHVDTGMGFERIVSVLQGVDSNYLTDLLKPLMDRVMELSGQNEQQRQENLTPYRVIADHARAAAFLIADGVVPGNTGRNYVCRMIIRRASRFGSKLGLHEPFLAEVADVVIKDYGDFYPELARNRAAILDSLTREEARFIRTVEGGVAKLESLFDRLRSSGGRILPGGQAFDLYATYGLPLELTRDIAREKGLDVDEQGFRQAMEAHRLASGAGEAFGPMGGEEVDIYRGLLNELQNRGAVSSEGVKNDPYSSLEAEGQLLAIIKDGQPAQSAQAGDRVELLLPETGFYVESGGQVSDTGKILSAGRGQDQVGWEVRVDEVRKPAAGVIVHAGEVISGQPKVGDLALAIVDEARRRDIMRNHTATHLLHAELRAVLGEHARQAGSLVAPDRLRFDFTHSEALTHQQLEQIEAGVNRRILENYPLKITFKPLQEAMREGAMALFGEKYAETVRTIAIGEQENSARDEPGHEAFSYELCGGTHVDETGDIGILLITSEGSTASGIRRIEAVTGRKAYELVQRRFQALKESASVLASTPEDVPHKVESLLAELTTARKQAAALRRELAFNEFAHGLDNPPTVKDVPVLAAELPGADADTLRQMTDRFRQRHQSGVVVLASAVEERPIVVASVTEDLVKRGLHAGELVRAVAQVLGGGGGGRPTLAQAGGKDSSLIPQSLKIVPGWVKQHLTSQEE
jgi:alanyl-tRNA synthetase